MKIPSIDSYVLPSIPAPSSDAPQWAITVAKATQEMADHAYLYGGSQSVSVFLNALNAWQTTNLNNRSLSADPANYQPTQFTMPVPQRMVYSVSSDGSTPYSLVTDPILAALVPPSLDAYIPPKPATPITSAAPTDEAATQNFQAAVINLLMQLKSDVSAIKAKLQA